MVRPAGVRAGPPKSLSWIKRWPPEPADVEIDALRATLRAANVDPNSFQGIVRPCRSARP